MASAIQARPAEEQARREQIEAEWANVGWCVGAVRPPSSHDPARAPRAALPVDRDNWQPTNQRCCP
ncbi:MAG TPA: hypothetical protein PKD09_10285 [Aggregatilinea sp.]|uniref:hypothetical protein n=1 Tax=Aggregatilinea sp. TaxID=2806333 RepID=UPI002D0FA2CB|nr:hypothetical protein [Aggregatilinea sp.]HML22029.1 hypothetical protein [Aggregatilinea sp.]